MATAAGVASGGRDAFDCGEHGAAESGVEMAGEEGGDGGDAPGRPVGWPGAVLHPRGGGKEGGGPCGRGGLPEGAEFLPVCVGVRVGTRRVFSGGEEAGDAEEEGLECGLGLFGGGVEGGPFAQLGEGGGAREEAEAVAVGAVAHAVHEGAVHGFVGGGLAHGLGEEAGSCEHTFIAGGVEEMCEPFFISSHGAG